MEENYVSYVELFKNNDVFADVTNVLAFHGREILNPDDLEDVPELQQYWEENGIVAEDNTIVTKSWRKKAYFCIDVEAVPDKYMPVKIYDHEFDIYRMQLSMHKDVLYPVIVLVLYFGATHWNYSLHLKDALDVPKIVEHVFSDFIVTNLIEVAYFSDEKINKFNSDFRVIADHFVQLRKNKEYKPGNYEIRHVDDVLKLENELLKKI